MSTDYVEAKKSPGTHPTCHDITGTIPFIGGPLDGQQWTSGECPVIADDVQYELRALALGRDLGDGECESNVWLAMIDKGVPIQECREMMERHFRVRELAPWPLPQDWNKESRGLAQLPGTFSSCFDVTGKVPFFGGPLDGQFLDDVSKSFHREGDFVYARRVVRSYIRKDDGLECNEWRAMVDDDMSLSESAALIRERFELQDIRQPLVGPGTNGWNVRVTRPKDAQ